MVRTASFAPPCRGPDRAWIPAETEANWLAPVEPTRRTVEVEAFCSWSSCRMSSSSRAFTIVGLISYGSEFTPKFSFRKFSTKPSELSG